jgi:hypothetical protein
MDVQQLPWRSAPHQRILALMSLLWLFGSRALLAAPGINDFSPLSGSPGTSVTINGSGFSGTSQVQFGIGSAIFVIVSDVRLIATVPLDATSGPITIQGSSGAGVSSGRFLVSPRIALLLPASGPPGATVLIQGDNLDGATAVQFNGTNASFSVTSPMQVQAIVPVGATSGPVRITTSAGSAVSPQAFVVTGNQPFITRFSPTNGAPGATVTVEGGNFTGATKVQFNGTNATSFAVNAATQLRAVVPVGASIGPISVTSALGTGQSAGSFLVTTAPVITDFQPLGGGPGTQVVINGANFEAATAVQFNGTNAASFSATASTQIHAVVPTGATPGPISITTALGSGSSVDSFFASTAPLITDFSPSIAAPGAMIAIDGLNFQNITSVSIAGAAASFSVNAPTQIGAIVPVAATNGPIVIKSALGTNVSSDVFFVRTGKPILFGFTPSAG